MTAQLDPWEIFGEDGPKHNHLASGVYANCEACGTVLDVPPAIPAEGISALPIVNLEEFELGTACNIGDTDCEACQ